MKHTIFLLLFLAMALLLCGCGGNAADPGADASDTQTAVTIDIKEAASQIAITYNISGGTRYSSEGNEMPKLDEDLIRFYYGDVTDLPDFSKVEAYEVYIDETKPTTPCEYAIFKLSDPSYASTLKKYLEERIAQKLANAKMYPSVKTSMLKTAKFTVRGGYVWYCAVLDANDAINDYLNGLFGGN